MKTKTISKVIVYYNDGTYEEVKVGLSDTQNQPNTNPAVKTPVTPDFRPDYHQIRDWPTVPTYQPTFIQPGVNPTPPWVVTCSTTGENLNWKTTSTENAPLDYKYTITSTGNGNVEVSK
jgi:hypothetical protein